jgi:hypothetical protein
LWRMKEENYLGRHQHRLPQLCKSKWSTSHHAEYPTFSVRRKLLSRNTPPNQCDRCLTC